ncbi:MAG: transketolase [Chloroflexota bacterium]
MTTIKDLELKSIRYRREILSMISKANAGHTAGDLSCIDILNVLYNKIMDIRPENFSSSHRDHYIQSKGHSVEALYAVLADIGFYDLADLDTLNQYKSHYVGHPTRAVNGIEHNTGALGHGLSVAVGIALALKKDLQPYRVFTLLGDGELEEGSNWEACMSAAHYQLDNLIAIVDRNTLQITDYTENVSQLEPLEDKFRAFGFSVKSVDGNSILDLTRVFEDIPFERGKPNLVMARTIKGKGISFIENNLAWHHHAPTSDEFHSAFHELDLAEMKWKQAYEPG